MSGINLLLAFVAGLLTTLSPCVLPVIPFVAGASLSRNRAGPLALAAGLLATFIGVTLLVSMSGFVFGLDPALLRRAAGFFLALSGALFLSQALSDRFGALLSRFTNKADPASVRTEAGSLYREFAAGILLGVVWTPCSGPSLGAALGLAAQAGTAGRAAFTLFTFGLGAVLPLLLFSYGARGFMGRFREHTTAISRIKKLFGAAMIVFGLLIAFNSDRLLEARLTRALPAFWADLVSRF
ncbi:MAG: cytochrome C biogenesis protein [Elusimicrobia bacterium CG_4_10_14_0_2_um_filter_56_8]|nr:MAG: cytochrome C biogenesis protein [Elusimicrobia bacterium CG_4_10_14_0_2_um_filter_56_8]